MTSLFSAPSGNPRVRRNTDGETDLEMHRSAPPEPLLRVIATCLGADTVLALVGEMDTTNTDTVREAVGHCLARKPDTLLLDLSGLTFCGAGGIHTLHWALRRAEADKVEFRLVAPAPWLRRVLTAIQAHELLAATAHPPWGTSAHAQPTIGRAGGRS
ncbi:MAG: polymerase sigma-B factor [Pseudonocardiales bacterium]|nr:polymerase sigma-B factor [Pseudonocardiales bacterium]